MSEQPDPTPPLGVVSTAVATYDPLTRLVEAAIQARELAQHVRDEAQHVRDEARRVSDEGKRLREASAELRRRSEASRAVLRWGSEVGAP
ncbi:MAG TPA: hypothetical protein VGB53_11815 [Rubricoccaceae bacterium]|jgi:hypothetical protein